MKDKKYVISAVTIVPVCANYKKLDATYEQHFFLCRDMDALVRDSVFWHYIHYYCPFKTERITDEEYGKMVTRGLCGNANEVFGGHNLIRKVLSDNFRSIDDIREFGEKIFTREYVDELMKIQPDTVFPYFDFNGGLYYNFNCVQIPKGGYDAFKKDICITSASDDVCEFNLTLYFNDYLGETLSEECHTCRAVKINGEWRLELPLLLNFMN